MSNNISLPHDRMVRGQGKNRMVEGEGGIDEKYKTGYDVGGYDAYKTWSGRFIKYQVEEGDTLDSIAKRFHVKAAEIALLNRKRGNMFSDNVNVGQTILVPQLSKGGEFIA